jgi:hypothetical protein
LFGGVLCYFFAITSTLDTSPLKFPHSSFELFVIPITFSQSKSSHTTGST